MVTYLLVAFTFIPDLGFCVDYSGPAFYIEIITVNIYAFCAKVIE